MEYMSTILRNKKNMRGPYIAGATRMYYYKNLLWEQEIIDESYHGEITKGFKPLHMAIPRLNIFSPRIGV